MLLRKDLQNAFEFSAVSNAECVPEICNEFVTIFLPRRKETFEVTKAVDLTRHMCNWLFMQGFTCSKISVIN
jgi:hypothetical protein